MPITAREYLTVAQTAVALWQHHQRTLANIRRDLDQIAIGEADLDNLLNTWHQHEQPPSHLAEPLATVQFAVADYTKRMRIIEGKRKQAARRRNRSDAPPMVGRTQQMRQITAEAEVDLGRATRAAMGQRSRAEPGGAQPSGAKPSGAQRGADLALLHATKDAIYEICHPVPGGVDYADLLDKLMLRSLGQLIDEALAEAIAEGRLAEVADGMYGIYHQRPTPEGALEGPGL